MRNLEFVPKAFYIYRYIFLLFILSLISLLFLSFILYSYYEKGFSF